MRKTLSILLAFAILAQGMVNLGLCAYYEINKKMIADKLCVNRNNPDLHCNGKCYLSKQLKKAEENEKKQSKSIFEKYEVNSIHDEQASIIYIPSLMLISLMGRYSSEGLSFPHIAPDQPPRV